MWLVLAYITPTILAALNKHPKAGKVAAVNLFLGWTVIGWWVSLFMAFGK